MTPLRASPRVSSRQSTDASDALQWSALIARVADHGDTDAFMQIHDHFAPRLKRYLLGLGVSAVEADDLVQEAMLRAWRRAGTFDPARASVTTWLFRITRNLYIDGRRRGGHWTAVDDGDDWMALHAEDEGAVSPDAFTDHVGLDRAIGALPGVQARLIRMSYLEAKSHSEIAAELDMPLGSVKSTLRRAFMKLKASLGEAP
ncbi:sigma-70 family RNA polymerase sigma factor [Marilutibacter penaei]|uniref:sigma-70 family RNA polymerase sigma factor n=1 Tax=Marilutibacter penaei TaxID=2759900 RepID=UPI003CCD3BF3